MFGIPRNRQALHQAPVEPSPVTPAADATRIFSSPDYLETIQRALPAKDKANFRLINKTARNVDIFYVKQAVVLKNEILKFDSKADTDLRHFKSLASRIEQLPPHLQGRARTTLIAKLHALPRSVYAEAVKTIQAQGGQLSIAGKIKLSLTLEKNLLDYLKTHRKLSKYVHAHPRDRMGFDAECRIHGTAFLERRAVLKTQLTAILGSPEIVDHLATASDEELHVFFEAFGKSSEQENTVAVLTMLAGRLQNVSNNRKPLAKIKEYALKTGVVAGHAMPLPATASLDAIHETTRMVQRIFYFARSGLLNVASGQVMPYASAPLFQSASTFYKKAGDKYGTAHKELFTLVNACLVRRPYATAADQTRAQRRAPAMAALIRQAPYLKPERQDVTLATFRTYFNGLTETGTPDNPSELTRMVRAHADGIDALAGTLPALQMSATSHSLSNNQKNALHEIARLKTHLTLHQLAELDTTMRGVLAMASTSGQLATEIEKLLGEART